MKTLSAHAWAQLVVQNDKISFDTKLHVFNVKGISGVTRVVTLFPWPSCSCPSTGECYYILAAKLIMGMSVSTKPARRNLTQLWWNTRNKKDKKVAGKSHDQRMWSLKSGWDACKQISLVLCSFTDGNVFDSGAEALDLLWECLNETLCTSDCEPFIKIMVAITNSRSMVTLVL